MLNVLANAGMAEWAIDGGGITAGRRIREHRRLGHWRRRKVGLHGASLRGRPLLLGFLQRFVNSAHSFLSSGRSFSSCRKRSASVASDRSASTKSNLSPFELGAGTGSAPDVVLSPKSKSRRHAIDHGGRDDLLLVHERADQAVLAQAG